VNGEKKEVREGVAGKCQVVVYVLGRGKRDLICGANPSPLLF
jgi:hypothetical protein